ncbi:MAG TPA: PIG-L family deacetylase [Chloroflexota bacterium]
MTTLPTSESQPRVLGVYAHPDDETMCTGGVFAKYASVGSEIMVVSATRGQAGQIRSGGIATRQTLASVREKELRLACERLGVQHAECWDYQDGSLQEVDRAELEARIKRVIRAFRPDIVVTFGDDGAYGHPDHIVISQATTAACLRAGGPCELYHAGFPRRGLLLMERLAEWLVDQDPEFKGDAAFLDGLVVLAEQASSLKFVDDHLEIKWFPSEFTIVEQGESATALFLLLAGHADVVREDETGTRRHVARLTPGQFFGELGVATRRPRNAHVVASGDATCLVLSPREPTLFEGRGQGARLVSLGSDRSADAETADDTIRVDVSEFIQPKLEAITAYRSQMPLRPDMLPATIFQDLFGAEYFTRVFKAPIARRHACRRESWRFLPSRDPTDASRP